MRCPKCGFHTFDHLDACKRCNTDLRPFKTQRGTASGLPPASLPPPSSPPLLDPPAPAPAIPAAPVFAPSLPSSPASPFSVPAATGAGVRVGDEKSIKEKLKIESQIKGGASAFYWIAVLSLINSIIILFGGSWNFLVGLGITRFIDVVAHGLAKGLGNMVSIMAFILDLFITGIFVAFGYFAGKRRNWSFILGMILYAIDGLLFLLVGDFLSMAFHALILLWIFTGLRANMKIAAIERKTSYA